MRCIWQLSHVINDSIFMHGDFGNIQALHRASMGMITCYELKEVD